jgi:hypothetical protein
LVANDVIGNRNSNDDKGVAYITNNNLIGLSDDLPKKRKMGFIFFIHLCPRFQDMRVFLLEFGSNRSRNFLPASRSNLGGILSVLGL